MHYLNFTLQRPYGVDIVVSNVLVRKWRLGEVSGSLEGSQLAKGGMGFSSPPPPARTAHVPPWGPHCLRACHEPWETSSVVQLQSPRHRTWSGGVFKRLRGVEKKVTWVLMEKIVLLIAAPKKK